MLLVTLLWPPLTGAVVGVGIVAASDSIGNGLIESTGAIDLRLFSCTVGHAVSLETTGGAPGTEAKSQWVHWVLVGCPNPGMLSTFVAIMPSHLKVVVPVVAIDTG